MVIEMSQPYFLKNDAIFVMASQAVHILHVSLFLILNHKELKSS